MDNPEVTRMHLEEAIPQVTGTLVLNGLEGTVKVYRDKFGIPHVRASTVNDAFFAQGFVTAQDRLWHMDYDRRRAYGKWAEVVGYDGFEQDVLMRRLRLKTSARLDYQAIGIEARTMLDAYSEGVNAFIYTTQRLPIEYSVLKIEPDSWRPWDCLAVFKVRHVLMGAMESKLWRARLLNALGPEITARLFPGYQEGHLLINPPGEVYKKSFDTLSSSNHQYISSDSVKKELEVFRQGSEWLEWLKDINDKQRDSGSNNWVLSGTRTSSGKPILAGDPHRALEVPNVYYQNHVDCPQFDAIGLSFPGVPGFPHFGHNEHVAWCVTHTGADCQDLYIEHFKAGDPSYYEFRGSWLKAETYSETVQVRNAQSKEITCTVTQHGPVIMGDPNNGYGISFKYTATAAAGGLWPQTLLSMLNSTSTKELEHSMRDWVDPVNNFLFSDVQGNIGYRTRGQIPIRNDANAWLPVPGWTGEYEWEGMVPFEEMPNTENPEIGYILTANNRPAGHQFPHYIALDFSPEFRARRLTENILPLWNTTIEEMSSIHSDCISIPATKFLSVLHKVSLKDEMSEKCLNLLSDWDGSMDADRVEPTIYSAFWHKFVRLAVAPLLGIQAEDAIGSVGRGAPVHLRSVALMILNAVEKEDVSFLPQNTDWSSLLSQGFVQAIDWLKETLGNDVGTWQWGKLHRTRIVHPLSTVYPQMASLINPPDIPMSGDGDTLHAASYSQDEPFTVVSSSVARYAFDLSDWNRSLWVVPLGVSGNPGSSHYIDQLSFWRRVKMVPMLYNWKEICAEAESRQYLQSQ